MERTLRFYMANLGSEISRAFSYKEKGQLDLSSKSFDRATHIINKMIVLPEAEKRQVEIKIISDLVNELKNESKSFYFTKKEDIKNYFIPFAQRIGV